MTNIMELVRKSAFQAVKEKLSSDAGYSGISEESREKRKRFNLRYPKAVCTKALELIDLECALGSIETESAFYLGLQIGIDLGRLNLLSDEF